MKRWITIVSVLVILASGIRRVFDNGLHRQWPRRAARRYIYSSLLTSWPFPRVVVRLEGGLYALALCPFGHITNAGLATNYDFVQPSFFTINARTRARAS